MAIVSGFELIQACKDIYTYCVQNPNCENCPLYYRIGKHSKERYCLINVPFKTWDGYGLCKMKEEYMIWVASNSSSD